MRLLRTATASSLGRAGLQQNIGLLRRAVTKLLLATRAVDHASACFVMLLAGAVMRSRYDCRSYSGGLFSPSAGW